MLQNFDFKRLLPHAVAVLLFLGLTYSFLSPVFKGKAILQSDIMQFKGMSNEIVDHRTKFNEEPLWTNSMFGGMPAYQISVLYKHDILQGIDRMLAFGLPHLAGYFFLYMLGFYILMLALRIDPWIGIVGAVAFAFSSYFVIILEVGHNSKAHAIGYMAPTFAGIFLAYRGKYLLGAGLTALFLALELYCNHLQITYYLFLFVLIFVIGEVYNAIKEKKLPHFFKASGFLAVAAVLAILANTGNLFMTYDYGKETTRGPSELTIKSDTSSNADIKTSGLDKDYAMNWSYGVGETMSLLIPNYKGGGNGAIGNEGKDVLDGVDDRMKEAVAGSDKYWGDQPGTSGPVYVGAIVFCLAVLCLVFLEGTFKWVLFVTTMLSIMLSWGSNFEGFSNFFFDYMPGYNKFRAVSMTLVIAELTIPIMAMLLLNEALKNNKFWSRNIKIPFVGEWPAKKTLLVFSGIVAGICLLFFIAPGTQEVYQTDERNSMIGQFMRSEQQLSPQQISGYVDQVLPQIGIARENILKKDAGRSFMLIGLGVLLLYFYVIRRFDYRIVAAGLLVLVLFDLWTVDRRYLDDKSYVPAKRAEIPFYPSVADEAILKDTDPNYRVLNLSVSTFNDASTSYFHKSIGGYHGAKLKRYQEMVEFHINKNIQNLVYGLNHPNSDSLLPGLMARQQVLHMLNMKYVILNPKGEPLRNPYAFGHAWFVKDVMTVPNADKDILALNLVDLRKTAVVDTRFANETKGAGFDSAASIKLTSYKANHLVYESNSSADQIAVFSEIYFKNGWNAYVDGKLTPHFRANYILRAMKVPSGKHKIEFKFEPEMYSKGNTLTLAGSAAVVLFALSAFIIEIRNFFREKKQISA